MRLAHTAHTSRPWRVHEITCGFRLEDVWALPTPGGPDDLPLLVELMTSGGPSRGSSRVGPRAVGGAVAARSGARVG